MSMLRITLLVVAAFLAVSFFGGSAIWSLLGVAEDLTIEGEATVVRAAPEPMGKGWPVYGGDQGGNRYAALDQITPGNVTDLEVAWTYQSGTFEGREDVRHRTSFQSTPILVEDSLVFCTQFNEIIALNPASGEQNWRYDAEVPLDIRPANNFNCRGIAYWTGAAPSDAGDLCTSRLFMGTVDARLIAVDARTGQACPGFGRNGQVKIEPDVSLRWPGEFSILSPPVVVGDVVVTGSAISDNLRTEAPLGTVHGFDVRTGDLLWKFNPVPRDPDDPARASWSGDSADKTGHANVWSIMSVDEERGLVFLPTSSPSPDYFGGNRIGDNHYANSVVALDGATGDVVWHYQLVHHDVWDYDIPAQPGLYTVWRDGQEHDVVAQITKMGLIFVLDRDIGEPFLPVEERPVPQAGAVADEVLSPTQPFPVNTPPLVPNELEPKDAFGITLWDKIACASEIRSLKRDGLYTPPTISGTLAYPFTGGGGNWGSGAFDPSRNLLIVNMNNAAQAFRLIPDAARAGDVTDLSHDAEFAPMEGAPYGMSREMVLSPLGLPCSPPPWGILAGVDLATGEIVWRQTLGTTEDLAGGLALKLGTPNMGGPIVTSSGVIFISATMDYYLRAFDVTTGKELWKGRLPTGGQATPMTYEADGRQFVVIAAGGHAMAGTPPGDYLMAFALPE